MRPPANIVIILGDDLGFSDMGGVRRRDQDAESRRVGRCWCALHELLHARHLFAHAFNPAERVDSHLNGLGNMDEWAAPNQWDREGTRGTSTTA